MISIIIRFTYKIYKILQEEAINLEKVFEFIKELMKLINRKIIIKINNTIQSKIFKLMIN